MYRRLLSLFLVLNVFLAAATAQTTTTSPAPQRDPAAVALLNQALANLGGASRWQAVRSLGISGTVTYVSKSKSGQSVVTHPIVWLDDWSTGQPRYSRAITDSKGQHVRKHDGSTQFSTTFRGKAFQVPEQDKTSILLTHAPAASLAIELNDSAYGFYFAPGVPNGSAPWITVFKAGRGELQQWSISSTGTVQEVRYTLPNVLHPSHRLWETVTYSGFQTQNGMSMPSSVRVVRPDNTALNIQITSTVMNPAVTADNFATGAAQ